MWKWLSVEVVESQCMRADERRDCVCRDGKGNGRRMPFFIYLQTGCKLLLLN